MPQLDSGYSLEKYHTYATKATAKRVIEIFSKEDLIQAMDYAKENNLTSVFLGRGSNVLFKENYYPGVVFVNKMKELSVEGTVVIAQGGVNMPLLARKTSKMGLSGLEYLVGVPGTVGGCVWMNAGVSGKEVSDHLVSVKVLTADGKERHFSKDDCEFSYRHSIFHKMEAYILEATFELQESPTAYASMQKYLEDRIQKQPVKARNSGCIFKNPDTGLSAGALIDQCGLKGVSVGDARVSSKHANFINNDGNATYSDIRSLIDLVQKTVEEKKGVKLECEVRIL